MFHRPQRWAVLAGAEAGSPPLWHSQCVPGARLAAIHSAPLLPGGFQMGSLRPREVDVLSRGHPAREGSADG